MRCRQARDLMAARLDDDLVHEKLVELEEHLVTCSACQAEWQSLCAVDQLLRSAPSRLAPIHLHAQIMARIDRREEARRAVVGGLALALGATAVALLTLIPTALRLLENLGVAPTLLIGGVGTVAQLLTLVDALSRTALVLLDQFSMPLMVLGLGSLVAALALNGLWIATMRKLSTAR